MRGGDPRSAWPSLVVVRLALGLLVLRRAEGSRLLQTAGSSRESLEIPYGALVRLRGLLKQVELNGQTGNVKAYDKKADRYEVWLTSANKGARIKSANIEVLEAAHVKGHQGWLKMRDGHYGEKGMKVKISGLAKTRGLNGLVGTVEDFDTKSERYLVRVKGAEKRVRPGNLEQQKTAGFLERGASAAGATANATASHRGAEAGGERQAAGAGTEAASQLELADTEEAEAVVREAEREAEKAEVQDPHEGPEDPPVRGDAEPLGADGAYEPSVGLDGVASATAPAGLADLPAEAEPLAWHVGDAAQLVGLKSAKHNSLNGIAVVVKGYDAKSQRYVVEMPGGGVKRVKAELRVRPELWKDDFKFKVVEAVPEAPPGPQLSVCNAYPGTQRMQVMAVSKDGSSRYSQVVHDLDYQSCADVQSLPFRPGALSVVVGRLEVARVAVNDTEQLDAHHGLELTVYRADANSLKATVRENHLEAGDGDGDAYFLHLVDAYAGARLLELKAKRGSFERKLPLGTTYRLKKEEPIQLTLTDGFQRLQLSFQPHKGHTYTLAATGADVGLKGEPRNVGLVAHEVGAWTASEEMPEQDPAARVSAPILQAAQLPQPRSAVQAQRAAGPERLALAPEPQLASAPDEAASDTSAEDQSESPLSWISDTAHRWLR